MRAYSLAFFVFGCFSGLARWVLLSLVAALLPSCTCLPRVGSLEAYNFSINHPRAIKVYKVAGGYPPEGDVAYAYLRIENTSADKLPISFGRWSERKKEWVSLFGRLKPVVTVESDGAPILGEPEIILTGLSSKTVCAGRFFPKNMPDSRDFPLNEANFDRTFAVKIRPDRSRVSQQGNMVLRFKLDYIDRRGMLAPASVPEAVVRIPISISSEYRPEAITTTPSVISNEQD